MDLKVNQSTSTTSSRYSNGKTPTNLSIDGELAELAKSFLPVTQYKSLSAWVDAQLIKLAKKEAAKMRRMGLSIPVRVFLKD
jgi:hypothetical protein